MILATYLSILLGITQPPQYEIKIVKSRYETRQQQEWSIEQIKDIIRDEVKKQKGSEMDLETCLSIAFCESSFNPKAVNPKSGAMGVYQLLPSTAHAWAVDNPFDPYDNISASVDKLIKKQYHHWKQCL